METQKQHVAECCCGKFSLLLKGNPNLHGVCHCQDCKKRTGSAFGVSVYFPTESLIQVKGANNCYTFVHKEQNHLQKRYFCQECGSTLYWTISDRPEIVGIAGGNIVDNTLPEPFYSVSDSQRCGWLELPDTWQTKP